MPVQRIHGSGRRRIGVLVAVLGAAAIGWLLWRAWDRGRPAPGGTALTDVPATPVPEEAASRIKAFCGDCHAPPRPDSIERARWHFGVRKGYEFYARSGRNDLHPPPISETLAWYRGHAPEELTFPEAADAGGRPPVSFRPEHVDLGSDAGALPEIAHLAWLRLAPDEAPLLVACDMRHGHVVALDPRPRNRRPPRLLARLRNPCRVEVCDLDGQGMDDLVVADLGSYLPADHDLGRVVLLRRLAESRDYEVVELATGLGRVADVRAGDFDGDGDQDLIVAEFGWHQTGRILLLRNTSTEPGRLQFERQEIDDRPGTIHVPVFDFNNDGRLDFAALVSQEHEAIDIFLNAGALRFARRNIHTAADLTFGSSGIELIDLNRDGALDVLYTNGDTFDNSYASPWHGVGWLENQGNLDFAHHRIADLTGAYRALADDFDADGDLDVLVVAWLPPNIQPAHLRDAARPSIVLLEQRGAGAFAPHTLESGSPDYATLAIGDFDADGDTDFAVGAGPNIAAAQTTAHALTFWWNQGRPDGSD